jgi:hypothetical protein
MAMQSTILKRERKKRRGHKNLDTKEKRKKQASEDTSHREQYRP